MLARAKVTTHAQFRARVRKGPGGGTARETALAKSETKINNHLVSYNKIANDDKRIADRVRLLGELDHEIYQVVRHVEEHRLRHGPTGVVHAQADGGVGRGARQRREGGGRCERRARAHRRPQTRGAEPVRKDLDVGLAGRGPAADRGLRECGVRVEDALRHRDDAPHQDGPRPCRLPRPTSGGRTTGRGGAAQRIRPGHAAHRLRDVHRPGDPALRHAGIAGATGTGEDSANKPLSQVHKAGAGAAGYTKLTATPAKPEDYPLVINALEYNAALLDHKPGFAINQGSATA